MKESYKSKLQLRKGKGNDSRIYVRTYIKYVERVEQDALQGFPRCSSQRTPI